MLNWLKANKENRKYIKPMAKYINKSYNQVKNKVHNIKFYRARTPIEKKIRVLLLAKLR